MIAQAKVTMRDYWKKRVARGAKWLDNTLPDWFLRIDIVRLDISSSCGCIVGQLERLPSHGGGRGIEEFAGAVYKYMPDARDFGVSMAPRDGEYPPTLDQWARQNPNTSRSIWDMLDDLWKEEINERLSRCSNHEPPPPLPKRNRQRFKSRFILDYETVAC